MNWAVCKPICYLLLVLGLAISAPAAEPAKGVASAVSIDRLNAHFPAWLRLSGEERLRVEGMRGIGYQPGAEDAFVMNRLRIGLTVMPFHWLSFSAEAQDSRVAGNNIKPAPSSQKDSLDLRVAYLELGNAAEGRFNVRAGRQSLLFGEGRLVADPNWSNTGRVFDAVRASLRQKGLRVDAFAASVVQPKDGEFNRSVGGDNLHGVYVSLSTLVPNATVEPYFFWRLASGMISETGVSGKLNSKTVGVRFAGNLPARFDYGTEIFGQSGTRAGDRIGAHAIHFVLGHTLANPRRRPRVSVEYNYATGDGDSKDGRQGGVDPLYPTTHDRLGLSDQFMLGNLHDVQLRFERKLHSSLTVIGSYHSFWLADQRGALYAPGAKLIARVKDGSGGSHVGQEYDIQALWTASKSTQWTWGYQSLFAGRFLRTAGKLSRYDSVFVNVGHRF